MRCYELTSQGDVNGPDTQPLYKYLKANSQPPVADIDWVSVVRCLERAGWS
jgi:glutathione peroxidase-family protein